MVFPKVRVSEFRHVTRFERGAVVILDLNTPGTKLKGRVLQIISDPGKREHPTRRDIQETHP
jgi:hypothetical protein